MRFEQLKHASNTIVRKKLYKSGKNWVVMSSLAFVGGLALLGSSQINTVKADVVYGSDTEEQQQVNTDPANTQGSVNNQDVNNGDANNNDKQNLSDSKKPVSTTPVTTENSNTKVTPSYDSNNGVEKESIQSNQDGINDNKPAPSADNTGIMPTSAPIPDSTPTTDDVEGDGWRIDNSTHTLYFTSSTTPLSGGQNYGWQDSKYQSGPDALTSIVFDSPVTAGTSLSFLFVGMTQVTSINELEKLDTKNTTDFSNMFTACMSLTSLDLKGLDTSSGTNFSNMFNACHSLKSIDISGLDTSKGTNFSAMFNSCYSLKDLDLSHIDMSNLEPSDYGGLLGGSPVETLKLSSKDKLIDAAISETPDGTGWFSNKYKAEDGKADALYSSDQLMNLYDGTNGADTTWQVSNLVNFKIKYVDKTDPKITYTDPTTYSAPLGSDYTVDKHLSYYGQIDNSTPLEVNPDSDGIIIYHTDLSPDKLIINEHYPNDSETKTSKFEPQINGKLDDYFKPTGWLIDANKLDNVDMEKSSAIYNNDTTNPRPFSEIKANYLSNQDNPSATPSLADLIKSDFSSFNVGDNKLVNKNQPLIEYNIYYKKDESTHTGPSHSYSTPTPTITDFNQNVATFGDRPAVQVYNTEGNTIDETVAPDVDWHSDKKMLLNGITYYNLATDKWVKSSDAYIFFANNADVRTYQGNYVQLTDGNNGKILSRELQAGSDWYTDRIAMFDGEKYYRVATSEFVKAPAVYEYKTEPRVVQTNKNTVVYDELGNTVNIHLQFSEYKSDIAVNINGNTYYRIATNLFVRADNI
ncbi:BspA family leucine-rich repeat surface protein [Companilactobacillus muriivasis]|uniref:BspA family leucine-rich repeat surface protein n=1 Tax=Companilactobacillus muriivasis TaxID=3081444 RepID=UPI0030C721D1